MTASVNLGKTKQAFGCSPYMEAYENEIRKHLVFLLEQGNAHAPFEKILANIDPKNRVARPANLPYSIWDLVEHIRIAQFDIVEFCMSESYQSPEWPKGYWPENAYEPTDQEWEQSVMKIKRDRQRMIALVKDPSKNIFKPFSYGDGQNIFKESLLIADHTAYHLGEVLIIRRLLNNW